MEAWEMELEIKAEGTREIYLMYFERFLERWGLTPDGLYEMRIGDLKSEDPRDHKRIEKMVKVQMAEMKRRGAAASTCRHLWKAVRSFFEAQGLEIKVKAKDMPRGQYNGQRLAMADQIREMWDAASWEFKKRNRALITFLKDSGLRVGDVAALNVDEYLEARTVLNEAGQPFKAFNPFETGKTGALAYIHIGPEAVEALDAYLEERRDEGGDLKPDSPLFLMRGGQRISRRALSNLFLRLRDKLGKEGRKISAHSLRKFHTTMLEASMPRTWIAKLQGKTINDSMGVYSQPELMPGELTQAYMKGYSRLRIFALAAPPVKEEEVRALRERVSSLEGTIGDMQRAIDHFFEFKPDVSRTPEERRRKAEDLIAALERVRSESP